MLIEIYRYSDSQEAAKINILRGIKEMIVFIKYRKEDKFQSEIETQVVAELGKMVVTSME